MADGITASRQGRESRYDLILLDVMLPKRDGFEVLRDLRRAGVQTPILMVTARAQEAEKVMELELGADDCVTKPFSPRELRARVKALLRRAPAQSPEAAASAIIHFGDCELDPSKPELRRHGLAVEMTALEFRLLETLLQNSGRVLTRERIMELVWGSDTNVTDRVIDNHIVKLRRKIEADPANPRIIVSVRGLGYRLDNNNTP